MTVVTFVCNHGVAGDPMFEWLPRVIASNKNTFVYLGEGVRAKYFFERARNERPCVEKYEEFMKDVAGSYLRAVEFYAYRAYDIHKTKFINRETKIINLIRNPFIWLNYYSIWRISNMGLPKDNNFALDHEWNSIDHESLFKLGFHYDKGQIDKWSFYRGVQILNKMVSDKNLTCLTLKLEDIFDSYSNFCKFKKFLGFNSEKISKVFFNNSKNYKYCRSLNSTYIRDSKSLIQNYKPWQLNALSNLWSKESKSFFSSMKYNTDID